MVVVGLTIWVTAAAAQQQADPDFDASVAKPAYTADGPRVLFDKAHHNFHTHNGRYKPFADLIRNDGFQITPNSGPFTAESLKGYDILVISNALGPFRSGGKRHDPAFTDAECDAVRDWVQGGGNLLFIADHHPMGSAAQRLADRFKVKMSSGWSEEYELTPESGLPADHPIVRGRSEEERVRKIKTFTGQSLQGPPDAATLIKLPPDAREKLPDPLDPENGERTESSVLYPAQGLAFAFGKGRVVILGEAGMLTAQVTGNGEKFGMNTPGIDNKQFALNLMHWLAGTLE